MEKIDSNMQKYENYKEQMGRLNKALRAEFYLEAIFIEYAILEDRIESVLRHSNKFHPEKHNTLNKKLGRLKEMQRQKNGLVRKYFSDELLDEIYAWKDERNVLIHSLMNQTLHKENLKELAERGQKMTKTVSSKASLYNSYLKRHEGQY